MALPWNEIDRFILWHFLLLQMPKKVVYEHDLPVDVDIVKNSYTEIYQAVKSKKKEIGRKRGFGLSHETFSDHLKRLVQIRFLREYPKGKNGRRRVYGFDLDKYLEIETAVVLKLSPKELDRRRLKMKHGLT